MWKRPASQGRKGGITKRRKSKCVVKQFGISSAVVELIRPIPGSNAGRLYCMMANIFFIFPSPSLSSSSPPSKEWPEVMIHKYTDSSINSNSIPDIISLNSLYSSTSVCSVNITEKSSHLGSYWLNNWEISIWLTVLSLCYKCALFTKCPRILVWLLEVGLCVLNILLPPPTPWSLNIKSIERPMGSCLSLVLTNSSEHLGLVAHLVPLQDTAGLLCCLLWLSSV